MIHVALALMLAGAAQSGAKPVDVAPLRTLRSPGGGFTVGVPRDGDWRIDEQPVSSAYPFALRVDIRNADGAGAFLYLLVPVDDIAAYVAAQQLPCVAQGMGGVACGLQIAQLQGRMAAVRWSGADAMAVLVKSVEQSGAAVSGYSARRLSENRAAYRARTTENDRDYDTVGVIRTFSIPNKLASEWAGQPEYWTFAMVAGCRSPTDSLDAATRNDCAAILNSMRTRRGWMNRMIDAAVAYEGEQMQREAQVLGAALAEQGQSGPDISAWQERMSQLSLQTGMSMIENTYTANQGVIQALGPTQSTLLDPSSNETMTTQTMYNYYCKNTNGDVLGSDSSLGSNPACSQQLQIVTPQD